MTWFQLNSREWINTDAFSKFMVIGSLVEISIEGYDALCESWVTLVEGFEFVTDAEIYLKNMLEGISVDKQIRKIEKEVKHSGKDLKKLEQMDKKRDKVCEVGEKAMKMKKKKK